MVGFNSFIYVAPILISSPLMRVGLHHSLKYSFSLLTERDPTFLYEQTQIRTVCCRLISRNISKNQTYRDSKSVAVRDFIVYDGLNVDGFQLEVNGNIDKPGHNHIKQNIQREPRTVRQYMIFQFLLLDKNKQNIWLVKLQSEILVVTVSRGRNLSWWVQSNAVWK